MDYSIVSGVGALVFFVSAIVFSTINTQKPFNSAFFVSVITCISYLIMLQFSDILFMRWIGYAFSCTTLAWVIGRYLWLLPARLLSVIFLTPLVMLTGALASYASSLWMIIWFVLSSLCYIILIWSLLQWNKKSFSSISQYIWFGWTVFPFVFLLSPEWFGIIPLWTAILLYLSLDIYTKIIFYKTPGITPSL